MKPNNLILSYLIETDKMFRAAYTRFFTLISLMAQAVKASRHVKNTKLLGPPPHLGTHSRVWESRAAGVQKHTPRLYGAFALRNTREGFLELHFQLGDVLWRHRHACLCLTLGDGVEQHLVEG